VIEEFTAEHAEIAGENQFQVLLGDLRAIGG
jgi:hypothetical protein